MILSIQDKQTIIRALQNRVTWLIRCHDEAISIETDTIADVEALIKLWRRDLERHERADKLSHERNQRKHSRRTQRGPIQ